MNIPRWLEAKHVAMFGAALIGYGTLRRVLKRGCWTSPPEDYAPMQPETLCDPTPKPGVVMFRDWVLKNYGGVDFGIIRECGGNMSGHTAGMAWDWGTTSGSPRVDALLDALQANDNELIRRTGLMYMIWNRRIWNTRSKTWQNYTGPSPHTDHVHFSFGSAGAWGKTSFYTEKC